MGDIRLKYNMLHTFTIYVYSIMQQDAVNGDGEGEVEVEGKGECRDTARCEKPYKKQPHGFESLCTYSVRTAMAIHIFAKLRIFYFLDNCVNH